MIAPWRAIQRRRAASLPLKAWWATRRFVKRWFTYREWRYRYLKVTGFFVRGHRGWADHDVWGLDNYLAGILAGALRRLADTTHAYPGYIPFDVVPKEEQEDRFETMEDWRAWLRDKADWFEWHHKDEDGLTPETNWIDPDIPEEVKKQRIDAHMAKLDRFQNEVLPDFIRHFRSLWD